MADILIKHGKEQGHLMQKRVYILKDAPKCRRWVYFFHFLLCFMSLLLQNKEWHCYEKSEVFTVAWHLSCSLPCSPHIHSPLPCLWMICCAAYCRGKLQLDPPHSHLHHWHFPHQWESVSIWCSPLNLSRIWSCLNVMPPCGLCVTTGVSHMTSRTQLDCLVRVCVCLFSATVILLPQLWLDWSLTGDWLCVLCRVSKTPWTCM